MYCVNARVHVDKSSGERQATESINRCFDFFKLNMYTWKSPARWCQDVSERNMVPKNENHPPHHIFNDYT